MASEKKYVGRMEFSVPCNFSKTSDHLVTIVIHKHTDPRKHYRRHEPFASSVSCTCIETNEGARLYTAVESTTCVQVWRNTRSRLANLIMEPGLPTGRLTINQLVSRRDFRRAALPLAYDDPPKLLKLGEYKHNYLYSVLSKKFMIELGEDLQVCMFHPDNSDSYLEVWNGKELLCSVTHDTEDKRTAKYGALNDYANNAKLVKTLLNAPKYTPELAKKYAAIAKKVRAEIDGEYSELDCSPVRHRAHV